MRRYHNVIITAVLVASLMAWPVHAADQWDKTLPLDTTLIPDFPAIQQENNEAIDRILQDYREGAKLAYNSASQIDVTAGQLACSNSAGTDREFRGQSSTITATWADIDTGSEATSTTYYVYAVCDTDIEGWTVSISANSSAPSGATQYRRLGSFYNDGSGDITLIANDDERFVVATGTVSHGGTIALPSGWSQDECEWHVSVGDISGTVSNARGLLNIEASANSSRVVTARYQTYNWVSASTTFTINGSANYAIVCQR